MLPPSLRGGGLFEQVFCLSLRPDIRPVTLDHLLLSSQPPAATG